ncbi:MAG: hypothetical protein KAR13_08250, partial [Desulfobulbaceae bacterium]|nr:hypothetical protein [Desulfobulbaceae bacterium]
MSLKGISELSQENLFEQATEDVSTYLWSVGTLSNPTEEYSQDHLLLLVLAYRARSRLALKKVYNTGPDYNDYKAKLEHIWRKAEKAFENLVHASGEELNGLAGNELIARLNGLESDLQNIQQIAQDFYVMQNSEFAGEDLRETAHDFLLRFQELSLTCEELQIKPLPACVDSIAFQEKFAQVDGLFQKYFGYFKMVESLFPAIRAREYNPDYWWFTRIPDPADVIEEEIPKNLMSILQKTYQAIKSDVTEKCAMSESAIAYAFHELDPVENKKMAKHLRKCRSCLDLVLDLRSADAEAQENQGKKPDLLPKLAEAIKSQPSSALVNQIVEAFGRYIDITFQVFQLAVAPPTPGMAMLRDANIRSEQRVEVKNGDTLKSGDKFEIQIKCNADVYAYLFFIDSSGATTELFAGKLSGGELKIENLKMDTATGRETAFLLISKKPIANFR